MLAEELHPASTANFVNIWFAGTRPRPDWISHDQVGGVGIIPPGDRDPIAFGCGIVFINFLHSQLGFSYRAICLVGGTGWSPLEIRVRSSSPALIRCISSCDSDKTTSSCTADGSRRSAW